MPYHRYPETALGFSGVTVYPRTTADANLLQSDAVRAWSTGRPEGRLGDEGMTYPEINCFHSGYPDGAVRMGVPASVLAVTQWRARRAPRAPELQAAAA